MRFVGHGVAAVLAVLAGTTQAADLGLAGTLTYRCVNPASGAHWRITIDPDRHVANSYAARLSGGEISWRDKSDAGNYDLDRATGRLTVTRASSTGGFTIFDSCGPVRRTPSASAGEAP